jgi:hypothetical protein
VSAAIGNLNNTRGFFLKIIIPKHVIPPGNPNDFIPVAQDRATNSAGLGYAILRALGVNEKLPNESIKYIQLFFDNNFDEFGGTTPHSSKLKTQTFFERISPQWGANNAARNASCYPGKNNRLSYQDIYKKIWIQQKWPELCKHISELNS